MIIRTPEREYYVVMDNRVLEDHRLSWKARGVIAYLLSKPDGWEVMTAELINSGPDGRQSVESALSELEHIGYLIRHHQVRGEKGHFDSVQTEIHECPTSGWPEARARKKAQVRTDADYPQPGNPRTDNPQAGNPRRVITNSSKTEESKTELVLVASEESKPFGDFWNIYPRRHGKRLNKPEATRHWNKLNQKDKEAAIVGAKLYAESVINGTTLSSKDPDRWLRDRKWEDWQEPSIPDVSHRTSDRRSAADSLADSLFGSLS